MAWGLQLEWMYCTVRGGVYDQCGDGDTAWGTVRVAFTINVESIIQLTWRETVTTGVFNQCGVYSKGGGIQLVGGIQSAEGAKSAGCPPHTNHPPPCKPYTPSMSLHLPTVIGASCIRYSIVNYIQLA